MRLLAGVGGLGLGRLLGGVVVLRVRREGAGGPFSHLRVVLVVSSLLGVCFVAPSRSPSSFVLPLACFVTGWWPCCRFSGLCVWVGLGWVGVVVVVVGGGAGELSAP